LNNLQIPNDTIHDWKQHTALYVADTARLSPHCFKVHGMKQLSENTNQSGPHSTYVVEQVKTSEKNLPSFFIDKPRLKNVKPETPEATFAEYF